MSKIITVFGATGQQDGSVIRTILQNPKLSQEFKIRSISREVSKPEAQALLRQGIEMKSADMASKESLSQVLQGSHSVFLVTTPAWGNAGSDAELVHGKNVANSAKETGVQHLIFSSLLKVTETSGGRLKHVPHFDHKALTQFGMLRKGDDDVYTLTYPVGKGAKFPLINIAKGMGKYVAAALLNRSEVLGSQVLAAADYHTPSRILAEFEEVTGPKTRFLQVDFDTYKSFIPGPMGLEMLENHLFIENPGYFNGRSLEESQNMLAKAGYQPESWKEFLEVNKSSLV